MKWSQDFRSVQLEGIGLWVSAKIGYARITDCWLDSDGDWWHGVKGQRAFKTGKKVIAWMVVPPGPEKENVQKY